MTRERINELWPVMEHFRNGGEVDSRTHGFSFWEPSVKDPRWLDDRDYRISTAPKLVPLDAEDWLNGGPWWVTELPLKPMMAVMVVSVDESCVRHLNDRGEFGSSSHGNMMKRVRRSGSDPEGKWKPCSKEEKK